MVILTLENDKIKTQVSGTPNINEAGRKEGELWNLDARNNNALSLSTSEVIGHPDRSCSASC